MLNETATPTDVDVTLTLCQKLANTLVLVPSYDGLSPHTEACIEWMRGLGAKVQHTTHCPDIALHRCMIATAAYDSLWLENAQCTYVLWLDSDVSIEKHELVKLYEDSDALRDAFPGLEASVSARYISKISGRLEAARAKDRDDVSTKTGRLQPANTGLGCFLQTAAGFARHCSNAPMAALGEGTMLRIVCASGAQFADSVLAWESEDWSYCRQEWAQGGVYLSRARARHSVMILAVPSNTDWLPAAGQPEPPADTHEPEASQPQPDAPETSR